MLFADGRNIDNQLLGWRSDLGKVAPCVAWLHYSSSWMPSDGGRANFVFLDGHVESKKSDYETLMDIRTENPSYNHSEPPWCPVGFYGHDGQTLP